MLLALAFRRANQTCSLHLRHGLVKPQRHGSQAGTMDLLYMSTISQGNHFLMIVHLYSRVTVETGFANRTRV